MIKKRLTCIAITSGSKLVTNLENSGQLFLTRRSKLLAFQVTNFSGSSFLFSSCDVSQLFSPSFFEGERVGFLADPSFSIGLKNRFMLLLFQQRDSAVYCFCSSSTIEPSLISSTSPSPCRILRYII